MSTWITPAGTIGDYTQGQSLTFTLNASTTLGGTLSYVLANGTSLPSGLSLNSTTGVISGTPSYVSVNTITYFSVSATETVNGIQNPNIQSFSILITSLVWQTSAGSIGVFSENTPITYQFTAIPSQLYNTVEYSILNGTLPVGSVSPVTLSNTGLLTGTPDSVVESTSYSFTIRAKEYNGSNLVGFKDRTFSITIDVSTPIPEFTTPSGTLFSALDSTWQSFQLQYIDQNPTSQIYIQVVLGELPPGLEINTTGLIRGYALPPVDGLGNPTTITYSFTLEISSDNGRSLSSYDITISNQELEVGFVGRAPTILNTRPLTFVPLDTDPYKAYYLTTDSMGQFLQDTQFIFKIIGHNFDDYENDNDLTYIINGPSIGITYDLATGWMNGLLSTIGVNVITYNFTVSVYRTSNPSLISDTFFLNATIVGDIVTEITWITPSDLGTINNGAISDLSVLAIGGTGVDINYRLIGTQIQSNLKTISNTGSQFNSFGDTGAFVTGSSDGLTWTNQTPINSPVSFLYFTTSVYDAANQVTIIAGYDQTDSAIIGQLTDVNYNYFPSAVQTPNPIRKIIYENSLYVAVGDNGTITTTVDPSLWTTIATTNVTNNLNGICYSTGIFGTQYIAVGDQGVILTSPDAITWTQQTSGTTLSLRSIIWTGTKYIIVGDLGIILTSDDGITFTVPQVFDNSYNFKTITIDSSLTRIVAAGGDGSIVESFTDGSTWTVIQNLISTADIYDIIYDNVTTDSFYMVGDGGIILVLNNDILSASYSQLTSPTLDRLPPDLTLLTTGDISGRLAFESTTSVVDQGVTKTYSLTVQAYSPTFSEITSVKTFTLTTVQQFYLPYDTVYIKALPSISDRNKLDQLWNSNAIIPPEYIYRSTDPYFGKSTSIVYDHIYGVPSIATDDFYTDYINAVQINHYWRNITLGEIKVAVAKDVNQNVIYEVVYSQIQDNLVNNAGQSISKQITWPRTINLHLNDWVDSLTTIYTSYTYYDQVPLVRQYISSLNSTTLVLNDVSGITVGMVMTAPENFSVTNDVYGSPPVVVSIDSNTSSVVVSVAQTLIANQQLLFNEPLYTSLTPGVARTLYPNSLPNMRQQIYDSLGRINDESLLPSWMTSLQTDGSILGFTPAWVICYVKPGYGNIIKNNIETQWPYTLNQIDFQLDRFEVDRSKTYDYNGAPLGQPSWGDLPSAQPNVTNDSADKYVYFPRKTILPDQTQE